MWQVQKLLRYLLLSISSNKKISLLVSLYVLLKFPSRYKNLKTTMFTMGFLDNKIIFNFHRINYILTSDNATVHHCRGHKNKESKIKNMSQNLYPKPYLSKACPFKIKYSKVKDKKNIIQKNRYIYFSFITLTYM